MVSSAPDVVLPPIDRFTRHAEQSRLYRSESRFTITAAGRRSGKTAIHKRKMYRAAASFRHPGGRFFFCAPTNDQARALYWDDLLHAFPPEFLLGRPRHTEMSVRLITGATIRVAGLDKPQRLEGGFIDGCVLDEYADMKPDVWSKHIRAGLSSPGRPPGFAWFLGVPDFRGPHFRALYNDAKSPDRPEWDAFHWKSADVLDPDEIEQAKADLDEVSFAQEYEASFVVATGRAYYPFDREIHARERLEYDPAEDLIFAFDFNVEPGVAVIAQERWFRRSPDERDDRKDVDDRITACIGEVWIPKDSNTEKVCRRLIKDWGHHEGNVLCYGDPSGGARGSAKVQGSDWDWIKSILRGHFRDRVKFRVDKKAPLEKTRVNAVNARLRTADGRLHMLVCPVKAPHVCDDLEMVALLEGGSGEIHKPSGSELTHISDAVGYYVEKAHGLGKHKLVVSR
ncbi:MAG: hypothetical protein GY856_36815 [bacterium]|nr:hypothetical protein [bacterium]